MGHTNPEETPSKEITNFPGKVGRSDHRNWVKVCPNCFSINIRPLTNISGTIVQEQWVCPNCDYTQDWCHDWMANDKWKEGVIRHNLSLGKESKGDSLEDADDGSG